LYTTPTCAYCTKAKQYFRDQRVPFTEYNVAQDQRRAEEMMRKSGQMGVPVIDVHGKIIVGFKQVEIERALRR
jgi:glutaredoxin-like YruB-family protein